MEEGVLVSWNVEEGAHISAGDIIAQVETDKATMDLEVYDDGVLLKQVIAEGDAVPIGALIAVLGAEGEDISEILARYQGPSGNGSGPATEAVTPAEAVTQPAVEEAQVAEPEVDQGRVKSSPLARRIAQEHGLDLGSVAGSGPEGRIIKRDVEAALKTPVRTVKPAKVEHTTGATVERISQMRKTIARRLSQSKFTAPHFYLTVDIDMDRAVAVRNQLNEVAAAQGRGKVSFNDLITKACALALRQHPYVNGAYLEEAGELRLYDEVHIAVAVAIDEGLITPVIRNADRKGLAEIAEETRRLADRARNRELQPEEFTGGTFSTSNLGMFGIEEFTAIINPPNACILAIGAIRDVPVVKDGAVVPGKRMKVTLSCDHRIVDGAVGSRFLADVKRYLEEPLSMLL